MSQRNERSMQWEIDSVSHWLIHHAARRAPECLSSRLEEEWLGDLEYRSTALSRLGLALGCCWTTAVIAKEYSRVQVPAASPVVAAKGMHHLCRSKLRLLLASLRYAFLRTGHNALPHARIGSRTEFIESSIELRAG
jgi:hypothetical protein